MLSTVPSTWQVLKGKLLFPVLHLPHWGSLPKTVLMMPFCFFTFYGLPLPNKTWGNPYIQDLTFKTKMTPPGVYIRHSPLMLQTSVVLVICLFLSLLCSRLQEMTFPRCQMTLQWDTDLRQGEEKQEVRVFLSLSALGWVAALPSPTSHQATSRHWIPQDSGFWEHRNPEEHLSLSPWH